VNDDPREDAEITAAEERLLGLLLLLRPDRARLDPRFNERVMRSVHWQSAVRGVAAALGSLAGALAEGLTLLLGMRRGSGGKEERR
jgi:hypothetical protein